MYYLPKIQTATDLFNYYSPLHKLYSQALDAIFKNQLLGSRKLVETCVPDQKTYKLDENLHQKTHSTLRQRTRRKFFIEVISKLCPSMGRTNNGHIVLAL